MTESPLQAAIALAPAHSAAEYRAQGERWLLLATAAVEEGDYEYATAYTNTAGLCRHKARLIETCQS